MGPTGLDPSGPIVVPGEGAEIAVSKQVAGNADLIRRGDSPGSCRRITGIVRSYTDTKPSDRVPGEDWPDRGVREGTPGWADP